MKLLPDPKVFQWVWCAALLVFWLLAALGCCKKNRVEAEVGIAGFPNGGGSGGTGGTNPLTRFRVPNDEMALPQGGEMRRLPHALLGKRLGRDMRHAELYTLTHKPRFPWVFLPCWDPPEDRITIHQVPWSVPVPDYESAVLDTYEFAEKDERTGHVLGDPILRLKGADPADLAAGSPLCTMDAPTANFFDATDYPTLRWRGSYERIQRFDPRNKLPRNPRGRTGAQGRGKLFLWGPNHALDLIITRDHPTTGKRLAKRFSMSSTTMLTLTLTLTRTLLG